MQVKKKKHLLHLVTLIVVGAAFIFLILYSINPPQNRVPVSQIKSDRYVSSTLNFSVEVPSTFEVKDTGITVIISSLNGKIEIARNGTQFGGLRDFLSDSNTKLNIVVEEEENMNINGYEASVRLEHPLANRNGRYKVYLIYANNYVYTLSTDSEALYDDLDQIAQSFRYVQ